MDHRQSVERLFSTTFARTDNCILGVVGNEILKHSSAEELGRYRVHDSKNNRPTRSAHNLSLSTRFRIEILRSLNYSPLFPVRYLSLHFCVSSALHTILKGVWGANGIMRFCIFRKRGLAPSVVREYPRCSQRTPNIPPKTALAVVNSFIL